MSVHYCCDNCENTFDKDELFEVTVTCSDQRLLSGSKRKKQKNIEHTTRKEWCELCISRVILDPDE